MNQPMNQPEKTGLRVADLCGHPGLPEITVLAGHDGLARTVADVHFTEQERAGDRTEAELHGNLLLVGTGPATPPYRVELVLRHAARNGAAAVLLTGNPGAPLRSTLGLADRLGLPLLGTADDRFMEVMHALLLVVRAGEVARAEIMRRLLGRLRARSATLPGIVRALEEVLGGPVCLMASGGTVLHGTPVEVPEGLRLDRDVPQQASGGATRVSAHPVGGPGTEATAWLLTASGSAAWAETASLALSLAEAPVRAVLLSQRLVAERDARHQRHVLDQVLTGGAGSEALERATALGWRLSGWHAAVRIGVRQSGPTPPDVVLRGPVVERTLRTGGLTGPLVPESGGWSTWVTFDAEPGQREVTALIAAVRRAVWDLPRDWETHAGIGRAAQGTAGLATTFREAYDAMAVARDADGPSACHVDELDVSRILAVWRRSEAVRAWADEALAPLRGTDNLPVLRTLSVYLDHGRSVKETAERLGVHRNTVTARVARAQELLTVDLDDPDQRLALQIAARTKLGEGFS